MAAKNGAITKKYLDNRLNSFRKEIKREMKDEMDAFKDDVKTELTNIKVEIIGEIRDMREEFDAHRFSHVRIDEELEDHAKRIATLEQ